MILAWVRLRRAPRSRRRVTDERRRSARRKRERTAARSGCARWRPSTRSCVSRPSRSCSARYPRALVVDAVRAVDERLRAEILRRSGRASRPPPRRRTSRRPRSRPGSPACSRRRSRRRCGVSSTPPASSCTPTWAGAAAAGGGRGRRHRRHELLGPRVRPGAGRGGSRQDPRPRRPLHVSPAPRTRSPSTTTPPPSCSRSHARRAAARCSWPAASSSRSADRLPHPRHPARERRRAGRGRHDQPHLPRGLRGGLDRAHAGAPARAHEQLPRRRVHGRAGAGGAGDAGARARRRC